jgi:hypothetical protein
MVACDWLWPKGCGKLSVSYIHMQFVLDTHLFAVEALIKYDTHTPDVDFGRDFGWIFAYDKALRRQVPIGAGTLRGQVHAVVRIVVFFVHHLGQTKVCNLYLSANVSLSQQDIAWRKWNTIKQTVSVAL